MAERDNLTSVEFPDDMHALFPSTAGSVIHGEARLFAGNKTARDSQKEQLELSIAQTGEEIRGMAARLAAKEEEGRLVGAEREKLQSLFERKIVEYQRVYTSQRDYARIMGEQGEIQASIARAKVRTSEIRVQIIAVDQNASTEAQKDLRTVEARIAELQERKLAIEDRLSRTEIRSPRPAISTNCSPTRWAASSLRRPRSRPWCRRMPTSSSRFAFRRPTSTR
ncbi:hypothetical protein ACQ5SK_32960 [Bradyrhizobium japonicum]